MSLKLGEINAKTIVKGILGIAIIYAAIILLTILSEFLLVPGTSAESEIYEFYRYMERIGAVATPILGVYLIKLVCEALYKVLRAAEIIINKNIKENNK